MQSGLSFQAWRQFMSAFFRHPTSRALGVVFALSSWSFAAWVVHIPYVKKALELDDARLGLVLFGLPIGQLCINPFAGAMVKRWGPAPTTVSATVLLALVLPLPVWAASPWLTATALAVLGALFALLNVAMNAAVMAAEDQFAADKTPVLAGRSILASCHGLWSAGGMIGSLLASGLLALGLQPLEHLLIAAGVVLFSVTSVAPVLYRIPAPLPATSAGQRSFIWPQGRLAGLIVVGLTALLAEGAAFDWSGVFLRDYRQASPAAAALGFTAFTLAMTLGRFTGDLIIPLFGERNLLFGGGMLGVAGLLLVLGIPWIGAAWLGFLLLGLGCSLGAPILFRLSMHIPGVSPAAGLATFATFSFLGFLVGPPSIGWIAKAYGLPVGLLLVAGLLGAGALLARRIV